jgi:hypothetical protein
MERGAHFSVFLPFLPIRAQCERPSLGVSFFNKRKDYLFDPQVRRHNLVLQVLQTKTSRYPTMNANCETI